MKIDFKKLIDCHSYGLEICMEMINWFLKTGNKYDEYTGRWTKDGISKQMFDYSANSHNCSFPFPIVCNNFIGNGSFSYNVLYGFLNNCLYNAIVKKPYKPVAKWRQDERIELGKYRMLNFNTDYPEKEIRNSKFRNSYFTLLELKEIIGTPLKKKLFHPNHIERLNPKIIDVILYTNGNGYVFEYVFSFENYDYEPGWSKYVSQQEGESIPCFLNRILNEIDLVTASATPNSAPGYSE